MGSLGSWTGWIAIGLFASAGTVPLAHRLFLGRRAAPGSRPIDLHTVLGLGTTTMAFAHAMSVLTSLGSPEAIAGGTAALGAGALAFFLLFAHVGVGLRLRSDRLRARVRLRRTHALIAAGIAVAFSLHVYALR